MKRLTTLEREVIMLVWNSDYHDGKYPVNNHVWSDHLFSKEQTGAVSSCVKKGYLGVQHVTAGGDTIWVTQEGAHMVFNNVFGFGQWWTVEDAKETVQDPDQIDGREDVEVEGFKQAIKDYERTGLPQVPKYYKS